ncbi:hypothetical protein PAI11_25730 [Patulibacter medicamentivorans]|uniref:Gluconate kinase n=1 Tax=Patulibacter medicamentivorans TaxID=1097667 RepID=H0E6X2_9ACTN|nr:bifunctional aminoglycoside phosphotransferase/ATP-binding protein [Patulibacter medicamentivorans]EHN10575.1 hypothetical protein PAI11_25730 [Patulibacter medicamentivorans]
MAPAPGTPTDAAIQAIAAAAGVDRPEALERRDTHMSVVLLSDARAYKIKRARQFAFADHHRLRARRRACMQELLVNRELAPDIYLGVRAVVADGAGHRLVDDDDPAAVEYVVEMRRFDEARTLRALLDDGADVSSEIERVAATIAGFHERARRIRRPARTAMAEASAKRMIAADDVELTGLLRGPLDAARLHAIDRRLRTFVRDHAEELADRGRRGMVREGHGDLRAEHVLLDGDVRIVDRIEFRDDLREIDVADDVAFLVMDLVALGRPDAARSFVDAYRAHHGDPGSDALIAFYAAHRALVRAKVALLRDPDSARQRPDLLEARRLLAVAEGFAWRTRQPLALIVSGPSGVGKSRLAATLARRSGFAVCSSDVVRKQAAGLAPEARGGPELYRPGSGPATYAALGRRAAEVLERDGGVIVDATCLRRADRDALREGLAGWHSAAVHVACIAPEHVLQERLARRLREPDRVSDATPEIGRAQAAAAEPLDEVPADRLVTVRTDRPCDRTVAAIAAILDV